MADYTLHLGYDWNSPTIGSIWKKPSSDRFLQYALADATPRPAWFQFQPEDRLFLQIWDLSSQAPIPSAWALNLAFSPLEAPTSGAIPSTAPSTYVSWSSSTATEQSRSVEGITNSYLELANITFSYNDPTGPWGPCRGQSAAIGPLTFTSAAGFKLSFYLSATVSRDGDRVTEVFLGDPEVIVGSTGSSN